MEERMSRVKNVTRNLIWGIFEKTFFIISPFITRTLIIYQLGDLYAGLGGLFTSILQMLNLAEMGVGSAIIYSMYKPIAENDVSTVRALLNTYKKIYRIIGAVVLGIGCCILPFIELIIKGDVPSDISVRFLFVIYLLATFFSYEFGAYKMSILYANQRNDLISNVQLVVDILQLFFQIIAIVIFRNYYIFVIVYAVGVVLTNVGAAIISKKKYPQYYCDGKIEQAIAREIKVNVKGMMLQKIGAVVLDSVDTIVISAFLGLTVLANYQNYYYIITAIFSVMMIIMKSLIASIGNSVVKETVEKNYTDFKVLNYMYISVVIIFSCCLLNLYQPFIKAWVGEQRMLSDVLVVIFVLYFFFHKWCDMLYVYQEATGIWWETRYVPLFAAVVNVSLNLFLVNYIGLAGVLLSTIIAVVFIYDIGYAYELFVQYFKSKKYLREYIVRQIQYLFFAMISLGTTFFLSSFIGCDTVFKIIIVILVSVIIPVSYIWVFTKNTTEFKKAFALLKGILYKSIEK